MLFYSVYFISNLHKGGCGTGKSTMIKKILILGATGMLGSSLLRYFSERVGEFLTAGTVRKSPKLPDAGCFRLYEGVNAGNLDSVRKVFRDFQPDVAVNCIGIIKQLEAAKDPLLCLEINAMFPHRLLRIAAESHTRLVHISTDCVFSGAKGMYTETDDPDAEDVYGKTKFLGELAASPNAITLRTSIIGHELHSALSLVDWFLSRTEPVTGYTKAVFSGFPTVEIAEVIEKQVIPNQALYGLYHLSADPVNKDSLLRKIASVYGKNIKITPSETPAVDRSLDSSRFRKATGYRPPSWDVLIRKMHSEYQKYQERRNV